MHQRLLAVIIMLLLLMPLTVVRAEEDSTRQILVLGDSVAAGQSAGEGKGFGNLVCNYMEESTGEGWELLNLGIPGQTTTDLLALLQQSDHVRSGVAASGVILVNTGGNHLLLPVIGQIARLAGISGDDPDIYRKLAQQSQGDPLWLIRVAAVLTSGSFSETLDAAVHQFNRDIPLLIHALRQMAPQAKIVFNELYNPFPEEAGLFRSALDPLISEMNRTLYEAAVHEPVRVAGVYEALRKSGSRGVYFNPQQGAYNPHPGNEGHKAMAQAVISALIDPLWRINGVTVFGTLRPVILDNRVFVPLRELAGAASAVLTWHGETREAELEWMGQTQLFSENQPGQNRSIQAVELQGRFYVPFRTVAEAFHGSIHWDKDLACAEMTMPVPH